MSKSASLPAQQGERGERPPNGVAPGVDRAQLRPDVEVDASRSEAGAGRPDEVEGGGQLRFGHAELRAAGTDGQPGMRFRRDVRVEAEQDVLGRAAVAPEAGPPSERGERRDLGLRLDGQPAERCAVGGRPDSRPQIGIATCRSPRA